MSARLPSNLPGGMSARHQQQSCKSSTCGCALAKKFGLEFSVSSQRHERREDGVEYRVVVSQTAGNTSDLSWSARAVSDNVMVPAPPPNSLKSTANEEEAKGEFAAWEFVFWFPAVRGSNSGSSKYELEITLTWINDRITGQKWKLPSRDDNPPLAEKKRKCLALELVGNCDRFGIPVVTAHINVPSLFSSKAAPRGFPLCQTTEQLAATGAWYRIGSGEAAAEDVASKGTTEEEMGLLDDFVGLNRFRGGVWRWQPRNCRVRWFSRAEALAGMMFPTAAAGAAGSGAKTAAAPIRRITLFGDSMILEQFLNLRRILQPGAPIRSFRQQKLRAMSFVATAATEGGGGGSLTVTFLRSYTTSGGRSVIAAPNVVVGQVLATKPDIIMGNAAVLHWQQNMRSLKEWTENINVIAKRLCGASSASLSSSSSSSSAGAAAGTSTRVRPTLFYWGPTLIQMGRTQGLQPHRTMEFGLAAERAFARACGAPAAAAAASRVSSTFWTYNASIARRESAHDGQHWACYKEYGGVAATFAQMFLNTLLN